MQEQIRATIFDWLSKQISIHGDVLSRDLLAQGLQIDGQRVPLIGPQGIFKPKILELPISITTSPNSPYNDAPDQKGNWEYAYRGTDPRHRDNVGLREAMKKQIPLIYFIGLRPNRYWTVFPVYIAGDNPQKLMFTVQAAAALKRIYADLDDEKYLRRYGSARIKVRLHQRRFREQVLDAYREQCACCRLRHLELLDAAHIVPDKEEKGEAIISNGISLCKLHHAAFDSNILGIRPDYVIEINKEVLQEKDGPMLQHGLQGLHNSRLILPSTKRHRPDPKRLEVRYEGFRSN